MPVSRWEPFNDDELDAIQDGLRGEAELDDPEPDIRARVVVADGCSRKSRRRAMLGPVAGRDGHAGGRVRWRSASPHAILRMQQESPGDAANVPGRDTKERGSLMHGERTSSTPGLPARACRVVADPPMTQVTAPKYRLTDQQARVLVAASRARVPTWTARGLSWDWPAGRWDRELLRPTAETVRRCADRLVDLELLRKVALSEHRNGYRITGEGSDEAARWEARER